MFCFNLIFQQLTLLYTFNIIARLIFFSSAKHKHKTVENVATRCEKTYLFDYCSKLDGLELVLFFVVKNRERAIIVENYLCLERHIELFKLPIKSFLKVFPVCGTIYFFDIFSDTTKTILSQPNL